MSRTVNILCDGGLGNRLSGLIGGMIATRQINGHFVVSWPANNWCGCYFDDLFEATDINHNSFNINEIFVPDHDKIYLIHENQTGHKLTNVYSHSESNIGIVGSQDKDIVYYHNKLMPYHDQDSIVRELSALRINANILDKIEKFCRNHAVDQTTIGLHLRKTENYNLNEQQLFEEIKANPHKKYFVCSDDGPTESKFCSLPNVCANSKTEYVTKMIPGDWYEPVTDTNGRLTKYNIQRSRQSVIEAFEDMLILSRCWIKPTVKSSFSALARFYSLLDITQQLNNNNHGHNESSPS